MYESSGTHSLSRASHMHILRWDGRSAFETGEAVTAVLSRNRKGGGRAVTLSVDAIMTHASRSLCATTQYRTTVRKRKRKTPKRMTTARRRTAATVLKASRGTAERCSFVRSIDRSLSIARRQIPSKTRPHYYRMIYESRLQGRALLIFRRASSHLPYKLKKE